MMMRAFGELGADGDHCIDAADVGHPEIHERDVRPVITKTLNGFASAESPRLPTHVRLHFGLWPRFLPA